MGEPDRPHRIRSRLAWTIPVAAVLGAFLWLLLPRSSWSPDEIRGLAGGLVRADTLDRSTTPSGVLREEIRLVGGDGLVLTARVERPAGTEGPLPGLVLLGGIQAGRRVLDHVSPPDLPMVRVSFDYPYVPPARFPGPLSFFRALPRAERGAEATVGGLLLALDYLRTRPDVNPRRITVAGASLGAAAAVIAGSVEPGFAGVAVLYGGGDLRGVVAANLPWGPRWFRSGVARAMNPWLARLEPTRYAGHISPRPLLLVNGTGDRIIPRDAVLALFEAAKEPKELVWLETGHKVIDEQEIMSRLVGTVVVWMDAHALLESGPEAP
jgi:dienelactone hydrolase